MVSRVLQLSLDYELLDSGEGRKLERFGSKIISRPSSLCIWKRLGGPWKKSNADYLPGKGWVFRCKPFAEWEVRVTAELCVKARLQRNGQVGMFPEHIQYLPHVMHALVDCKEDPPQVLNLFASSGLASLICLAVGAQVTHVDKSKQALEWADVNFRMNGLGGRARMIAEDAVRFLQREVRRSRKYDVVIADPPNFSRLSRTQTWQLDQVVLDLVTALSAVLSPSGRLFLTCHQSYGFAETVANLLYRPGQGENTGLVCESLTIKEAQTPRRIPVGVLLYGSLPSCPSP